MIHHYENAAEILLEFTELSELLKPKMWDEILYKTKNFLEFSKFSTKFLKFSVKFLATEVTYVTTLVPIKASCPCCKL